MHKNVGNELMGFKIGREMVVQAKIIVKINPLLLQYQLKNKHQYINNNDVFCHNWQMTEATGTILILKVHYFLKKFSTS